MSREFERIEHERLSYMRVFLVRLVTRTPHLHRDVELGLLLEGTLTVQAGEQTRQLCAGDGYLIDSTTVHAFHAGENGALLLAIQISPPHLEGVLPGLSVLHFGSPLSLRSQLDAAGMAQLSALCAGLACAYFGKETWSGYSCLAFCAALLAFLCEHFSQTLPDRGDLSISGQQARRILSVTEFIDQNFRRKLLLEEIAEREHLTLTYLSHLFKNVLGISFQEYLKEKRFEYACRQIAFSERGILDISVESGFSDVRYLAEMFRKRFGCTPRDYRRSGAVQKNQRDLLAGSTQIFFTPDEALAVMMRLRETALLELGKQGDGMLLFREKMGPSG